MTRQTRVEACEAQSPQQEGELNFSTNYASSPSLVWPPTLELFFDHDFNLEAPLGNYVNTKYSLVTHALVIELTFRSQCKWRWVMTRLKCHSHTRGL